MVQPGQRLLTANEQEWDEKCGHFYGYNALTLFRNLQKWSLA